MSHTNNTFIFFFILRSEDIQSSVRPTDITFVLFLVSLPSIGYAEVRGDDQCLLGDSVTEVKYRRARLVLGWVTTKEDGTL